jgi:hypothetical protein
MADDVLNSIVSTADKTHYVTKGCLVAYLYWDRGGGNRLISYNREERPHSGRNAVEDRGGARVLQGRDELGES